MHDGVGQMSNLVVVRRDWGNKYDAIQCLRLYAERGQIPVLKIDNWAS